MLNEKLQEKLLSVFGKKINRIINNVLTDTLIK